MSERGALGLLSRGRDIGEAEFGEVRLATVAAAIRFAWRELLKHARVDSTTAGEPQISEALEQELNELRLLPEGAQIGFDRPLWAKVRCECGVRSADGLQEGHVDLIFDHDGAPDLPYAEHALFVECKIIGPGFPVRRYCVDGLMRFVEGKYAGAMCDAFMLAYVRDESTVPDTLTPQLRKKPAYQVEDYPRRIVGPDAPHVWRSRHRRPAFGRVPQIAIDHLWMNCEGA